MGLCIKLVLMVAWCGLVQKGRGVGQYRKVVLTVAQCGLVQEGRFNGCSVWVSIERSF